MLSDVLEDHEKVITVNLKAPQNILQELSQTNSSRFEKRRLARPEEEEVTLLKAKGVKVIDVIQNHKSTGLSFEGKT